MLKIKGYNLQSFTLGSKHVRAFSLDNFSGVIIDYVLAECGAEKSPFPTEFYNKINFGDGAIKLNSSDDLASYIVTRDNVALSQITGSIEDDLGDLEDIIRQGKHIIPGTMSFMNSPKAKFLGIVCQFTESQTQKRERFNHPVAEDIYKRLQKINLQAKEHPSEVNVKLAFRKKLSSSYILRGKDDYLNVIINIGDCAINELWPDSEDTKSRTTIIEDTRVGYISIDVQIIFDPRRKLIEKDIDAHWKEFLSLKIRIAELLEGVGFETT
jgi:hypothetical protein